MTLGAFSFSPILAVSCGAIAGAILGSFMATLAVRWPEGRGVLRGRSCCDGCERKLAPMDLIPIISWVMLRGHCRTCGGKIALTHIVFELAASAIGAAALAFAPNIGGAALALLGWQLLLLGWLDARHWWLPHRLSALMAISGVICGGAAMAALGHDVTRVDRAMGMALGYASLAAIALVYRALRGRDGLGGGDAPMLGAIGAWVGWTSLPFVLLLAAMAGIAIAIMRNMRANAGQDREPLAQMRLPLGTLMAFAVPFALLALDMRL